MLGGCGLIAAAADAAAAAVDVIEAVSPRKYSWLPRRRRRRLKIVTKQLAEAAALRSKVAAGGDACPV
eukprot:scaffold229290_cov28-Tisochrysis_lutea.AAC.6